MIRYAGTMSRATAGTIADDRIFVLEMRGHGNALRENDLHGGWHRRYLNVTGRWSASGTKAVPLVVWADADLARKAAGQACEARGREIIASAIAASDSLPVVPFTDSLRPALLGYLPYSTAAARKLEIEREKTVQYAKAILQVLDVEDERMIPAAAKQVSKSLMDRFGGGSPAAAAAYLGGKKAAYIIARLLDGELECDDGLTPQDVLRAALSANISLQRAAAGATK